MILEYHRPNTLTEALDLLARDTPVTLPLAGGSVVCGLLHRHCPSSQPVAVVDLQRLGLNKIQPVGNFLQLGAMVTLQDLLEFIGPNVPAVPSGPIRHSPALKARMTLDETSTLAKASTLAKVIQHEATYNLRQVATIAGTLVAADGRSPFAAAFLALDAALMIRCSDGLGPPLPSVSSSAQASAVSCCNDGEQIGMGDLRCTSPSLPFRTACSERQRLRRRLITRVTIPLNARLAYEYVARTPADQPIVCVAVAAWPSGRTRVVLGGWGSMPLLAFDGTCECTPMYSSTSPPAGAELAAESASGVLDRHSLAGDQWASAEYRRQVAKVLTLRCLEDLKVG